MAPAALRRTSLAIALGANLPSPAGDPIATLVAVRPQLEALLQATQLQAIHLQASQLQDAQLGGCGIRWSPLFCTAPVGGPPDQPDYINAVLLVEAPAAATPAGALALLAALQDLEARFGRTPLAEREHWGARSLDLDLLWWGDLALQRGARGGRPALQLPHPHWRERAFVLAPLAALLGQAGPREGLSPLAARPGWPEAG